MGFVTQHVVVIAHDDATVRINHFTLVTFDVEVRASEILFINKVPILRESIVRDSEKRPAQSIEVSHGWSIGVSSGFACGLLFFGPEPAANPLLRTM